MKRPEGPWIAALTTGATLLLLVAALVVQHLTHGWPFSLHHGFGGDAPMQRAAHPSDEPHPIEHTRVAIDVSTAQLESIGLRTERVIRKTLARPIRAVAIVVPDESRVSHVHTRVAGWIEALHVSTTGQTVRAGQPLAGIFSQELLSTQAEYLAARRSALAGAGQQSAVLEGARARLEVLGMSDAEIRGIEARGEPRRLVTVVAPRSGVVLRRGISVGTAVDPSTELVTIADLSRVWLLAEVTEEDAPHVAPGSTARIDVPGSGRPPFEAEVEFIYPTLSERTRTVRARFVLDNRDGALRPGLYGTAELQGSAREVLTVSRDAVVDTGTEQHVFIVVEAGRFEPRVVKLGLRLQDRVEIREGLMEGDEVVASGVFLIDSESRLRASGGTGHVGHGSSPAARVEGGHEGH